MSTFTTAASQADMATPRDWLGLAILALPCLLYSMDLTVLNLAVPHLVAALDPSAAQLLWIVDIYGFVLAGALITMGALGDKIGRRLLLLWGALAFGLASILAAFAPNVEVLILARALLGLAAATLAPSTLSLISNIFRVEHQRSLAIGVWMASFSLGGAIGPVVGGALLEHFWWGSVFLVSVPVMILLLAAGPLVLPEYKDPNGGRIDVTGALMSIATLLALVYALKQFISGHADFVSLLALGAGLLLGTLFVRKQLASLNPMVDLRLFRRPAFVMPVGIYFLGLFLAFGTLLLLAQHLQLVLGLSPFTAGLWTLFSAAGFVGGSLLAPLLARRWPATGIIPASLLLSALGFVVLSASVLSASFAGLLVGSFLLSLGIAPILTLSTELIVGAVPSERAGAAAAIAETASELGGALGIAVIGSIALVVYRGQMTDLPAMLPGPVRSAMLEGIGTAREGLASAGLADDAELGRAVEAAFSIGFASVAGLAAAIAVLAAGLTLVVARR